MIESGEVKVGRVNASKSLIETPIGLVAEGGRHGNEAEQRDLAPTCRQRRIPRSRCTEGTHPDCVSNVRNMVTPMRSAGTQ